MIAGGLPDRAPRLGFSARSPQLVHLVESKTLICRYMHPSHNLVGEQISFLNEGIEQTPADSLCKHPITRVMLYHDQKVVRGFNKNGLMDDNMTQSGPFSPKGCVNPLGFVGPKIDHCRRALVTTHRFCLDTFITAKDSLVSFNCWPKNGTSGVCDSTSFCLAQPLQHSCAQPRWPRWHESIPPTTRPHFTSFEAA